MSKKVLSVMIVAAAFGLATAGRTHTKTKSAERETRIEQLKKDVYQVASKPRFTEYRGAIEYVRKQAEALGLEVKVEPVNGLLQWERGDKDQCELILPDGARSPLRMVALTPSVGGEVQGEIVLVRDFNKGWEPASRFDEGGKTLIPYFADRLKRDHTINGYVEVVDQRNHGASRAAMFGAKAVLVRSVQTGDGPPHTGAVMYVKGLEIPAAALSVEAADRLEQELQKHGKVSVRLKINPKPKPTKREQANVVIRIPGTSLAKEIVVLSAHFDSHDITPGAADDAAGVAAVLSVMRKFAKNRPARTILFVLFADEELDGSGSKAFLKTHEQDLANTVTAMELDDGDGAPYALQVTSSVPEAEAAKLRLRKIAESVGEEAKGLPTLTSKGTNGADLEKLWECHGIPEVAILQDLTTYFDRHHAENDTPDNINWDGLERTTRLLERIMQVLTSGAVTPLPGLKKLPCLAG